MKISVVTISLNQAQFIEQAILSVLSQGYADFEYIIVDAGSTDGSRDIIQKYRTRLASMIFEMDNGPADGLNKGFSKATGDIFYYLNADDYLLPGALQLAENYFSKMPQLDVIYGNGLVVDHNGQIVKRLFCSRWDLRSYVIGTVSVIQQATFIRGTAFRKVGGFNTNNSTCWDYELLADLAINDCTIKQVKGIFGAFRIHDDSITGSGQFRQEIQKDLARIRRLYLGRDPRWTDKYVLIYFRLKKIIMEPDLIYNRIYDFLISWYR